MKNRLIILTLCCTLFNLTQAADSIKIRNLYQNGVNLSDYAKDNEDQFITIEGYMAPPLQAESNFFVLTRRPMSVCPFCETDADWPDDILAVYTKRTVKVIDFNTKITVRGKLQIGSYTDKATGFVSQLRLENATYSQ